MGIFYDIYDNEQFRIWTNASWDYRMPFVTISILTDYVKDRSNVSVA